MTADVLRADHAARLRAAEARWDAEAMKRDLHNARVEARHARVSAFVAAARRHSSARVGRFIHRSPA